MIIALSAVPVKKRYRLVAAEHGLSKSSNNKYTFCEIIYIFNEKYLKGLIYKQV